ncbi:MAG: Coenzyme F420 hydrogenase/dehydrogenase, beta subunit C-terminal domain [Clostridia bacterium]|nr:Coenzyme F420 hydrogenase/dehydrogenase, beta subunit C-terminal domain [Clostridia bacterium]
MNTYLIENEKSRCCGCAICSFACPTKAIHMDYDDEGFAFPAVDDSLCVKCGKCKAVCPMDVFKKQEEQATAYAAYSKDNAIIKTSSSGGIFAELAKKFILSGGKVCGCTIDDEHQVKHILINCVDELSLLQGSKYVQSDLSNCLNKLSALLKQGEKVLFVGTPCQVSAVKNHFDCKSLITVDLLCHGVPSQKLFDFYIKYLEEKHKGKLTEIVFRDKEKFGWSITQRYKIQKKNKIKTYYLERHTSEYFSGFLRNMTQRESCYSCPYTTINRVGDITLADFWGVDKVRPDLLNLDGTSLIFVNSKKGENLIEQIKDRIFISEVSFDDAIYQNINFVSPPRKHALRSRIYDLIFKYGFKEIGKKHLLPKNSYKYKIAQFLNINVTKMRLLRRK